MTLTTDLFVLEYIAADSSYGFAIGKNPVAMRNELREEGVIGFNDAVLMDRLDMFPQLQERFRVYLNALKA